MKLHHYETAGGKDLILDYIDRLNKNEQTDGLAVLQKLKNNMLHACRKQKNKTEQKDSEIVIKRAKKIGEMLSEKFI